MEMYHSRSDQEACVLETRTAKTNSAESSCSSVSDSRRPLVKQSRYQSMTPGFTIHESSRGRKQKRTFNTPVSSFACQIKLSCKRAVTPSCNTGVSITPNFCCGKTEPRKLHTALTSLFTWLISLVFLFTLLFSDLEEGFSFPNFSL